MSLAARLCAREQVSSNTIWFGDERCDGMRRTLQMQFGARRQPIAPDTIDGPASLERDACYERAIILGLQLRCPAAAIEPVGLLAAGSAARTQVALAIKGTDGISKHIRIFNFGVSSSNVTMTQ